VLSANYGAVDVVGNMTIAWVKNLKEQKIDVSLASLEKVQSNSQEIETRKVKS
jgi:hypothetical protein